MTNFDFNAIKRLDNSVTKKLIQYINSDRNLDEIFINLRSKYPLIENSNFRLPYIMWLCCDYKDKDNLTYIDKLIAHDTTLTPQEISILLDKKDSYVSIFRVKSTKGLKTNVFDHILKKGYQLDEYFQQGVVTKGDFIIGRVGNVLGSRMFLGEINFVNKSTLNIILRLILKDYNTKNQNHTESGLYQYLKNENLSVYSYYLKASLDLLEGSDEYLPPIYSELETFQEYLNIKRDSDVVHNYIKALWELNNFYLHNKNIDFMKINEMDIVDFFDYAILFRFISNKDEFRVFYNALKEYLLFKYRKNPSIYSNQINTIKTIGENSFKYIDGFKDSNIVSQLDFTLSRQILESFNDEAMNYIDDFTNMAYHLIDFEGLILTPAKAFIKVSDMELLRSSFNGDYKLLFSVPNKMKVPIIELFYQLGLSMGIFEIKNGRLILSEASDDYFLISDSNKIWNHIRTLFESETINMTMSFDIVRAEKFKLTIFEILSSCPLSLLNEFDKFNKYKFKLEEVMLYIRYLSFMGIISQDSYYGKVSLTQLGSVLLPSIMSLNESNESQIIKLI